MERKPFSQNRNLNASDVNVIVIHYNRYFQQVNKGIKSHHNKKEMLLIVLKNLESALRLNQ